MAALSIRKKKDGTYSIIGEFPKEHIFTSTKFAELAMDGVIVHQQEDIVTLKFENAEADYEIVSRPGDNPEMPNAFVLKMKKARKV